MPVEYELPEFFLALRERVLVPQINDTFSFPSDPRETTSLPVLAETRQDAKKRQSMMESYFIVFAKFQNFQKAKNVKTLESEVPVVSRKEVIASCSYRVPPSVLVIIFGAKGGMLKRYLAVEIWF